MNTEQEKSEQRTQLDRQHRIEWNDTLDLETEARSALYTKHEEERSRLYLEEINFHERATLETQQAKEIHDLKHKDKETRVAIQKRHMQETDVLNRSLG